jgi:hypothetical protein
MDKQKIIENFINASIKQGESIEEGNWKVANRQYKIIEKSYQHLRKLDEKSVYELIKLLDYNNDYVKLWSATYSLSIDEEKAKNVLKILSNKSGGLGLTAKMTLQEWEKGNIKY